MDSNEPSLRTARSFRENGARGRFHEVFRRARLERGILDSLACSLHVTEQRGGQFSAFEVVEGNRKQCAIVREVEALACQHRAKLGNVITGVRTRQLTSASSA